MNLKRIISEMSLPAIRNEEDAVERIKQAYNTSVIKKTPNTDFYGPLSMALHFLQKTTSPEKYAREIKMGIAAKKAMDSYRSTKATQEVQFRAKPAMQSFEKKPAGQQVGARQTVGA